MEISETDFYYVASFFPNAEEVEIDDKPESGWKAVMGKLNGEHVVMKVMYAKDKFDLDKAIDLAKNIGDCAICKRLDADVAKVKQINLRGQQPIITPAASTILQTQQKSDAGSSLFNTGNPLEDMLVRLRFNTQLNPTGKALAALALDDDELAREVMPTDARGMVKLVADLTSYASGKGNIYRSPKEVEEYIKALHAGNKSETEKTEDKKKKSSIKTIVIS